MPAPIPQSSRENQIDNLPGLKFIAWPNGYCGARSKATVVCGCGYSWDSAVKHLIRGHGCPACRGVPRYEQREREDQINSLPRVTFVEWVDGYFGARSKATVRCDCGLTWNSAVKHLMRGHGCPSCAKTGFDPGKPGTLYALKSDCGRHVKIGVSNSYEKRIHTLSRETPFDFTVVALLHLDDGAAVFDLEKMFHAGFESSGFSRFDGCSEWLTFSETILELLTILGAECVSIRP